MKKFTIVALAVVLTVSVMAGCRRSNGDMTTEPTQTMQTDEMTVPTVPPTVNLPTDNTGSTETQGEDTIPRGIMN